MDGSRQYESQIIVKMWDLIVTIIGTMMSVGERIKFGANVPESYTNSIIVQVGCLDLELHILPHHDRCSSFIRRSSFIPLNRIMTC